jgi:hypothetical protein
MLKVHCLWEMVQSECRMGTADREKLEGVLDH